MLPPSRERPRGRQARRQRHSWQVLAERNESVAPVGIWVESGPQESLAFAAAFQVEEELKEQQRQKAASLRRFQGEVRQRASRQLRLRRQQQLQRSCEAAERESSVALRYSGSALPLPPRKNTCLFRSHPAPVIRCAASPAQRQEVLNEPFQQQATELRRTVKEVRRKLAARKTVAAPPELPGGVWRREQPVSCPMAPAGGDGKELLLAGHHDLPAELQDRGTPLHRAEEVDDFYIKIEFNKVFEESEKDLSSPERPRTPHHTPLALWAGVDQEETKKQRQNEYLSYRRLFMTIEREQVKEQQKQRERQKRVAQIKSRQESQRRAAERRMREERRWPVKKPREPSAGDGACETLAQLRLEERRVEKVLEKQRRAKERGRYVEALRARLREKMKLHNIDLPPLCCCGADFWDSHPDTCANNCVFYRNHQAYSHALQSLVSSCGPLAGQQLRDLAAFCVKQL